MSTVPLTALWLPILLSAVFVFVISSILHMVLGAWHRGDYGKASTEGALVDAIKSLPSGQYLVPCHDFAKLTPEQRAEAMKGPSAMMLLRNPPASFPATLGIWFVYALVVSLFVAYLTSVTVQAGAAYLHVHRVAGTAAFLAWSLGQATDSIWFGRPWKVTLKHMIDGLIYALVTGGTFGWLWPAA